MKIDKEKVKEVAVRIGELALIGVAVYYVGKAMPYVESKTKSLFDKATKQTTPIEQAGEIK